MLTCENCGNGFATSVVIDGKRHYLNKRRYCLDCSPFGGRNRRRLHVVPMGKDEVRICRGCGGEKTWKDFYHRNHKGGQVRGECKQCAAKDRKKRLDWFKKQCVDYKGGQCRICEYHKCFHSMSFHHVDPADKDFSISSMRFGYKMTDEVRRELDKCVLVCMNCHGEIHAGITECPVV